MNLEVAAALARATAFEQEPRAPLGFVDPRLEQTCAGDVSLLVAKTVRRAQTCRQLLVVVAQLGKHVQGGDEVRVVVEDTLQAADVADGAQRRAADLTDALRDRIRRGEDLLALLVEEKMIV